MGFWVGLAIFLAIAAYCWRASKRSSAPQAEARPDQPYSVFTRDFDIVCSADQVDGILGTYASNLAPSMYSFGSPEERNSTAKERLSLRRSLAIGKTAQDFTNCAILILLDQSGSMAERMPRIAADVAIAVERLEAAGAEVMLAGFTTVGWHGGQSRVSWKNAGQISYPGRLCDLLHIVHKPFDTEAKNWRPNLLFETQALFENIDGEALEWGADVLLKRSALNRQLIILSDGAPVDDSTLQQNDSGLLWRHLEEIVDDIQTSGVVKLGGIGIDHSVEGLYQNAGYCSDDDALDEEIIKMVQTLCVKS